MPFISTSKLLKTVSNPTAFSVISQTVVVIFCLYFYRHLIKLYNRNQKTTLKMLRKVRWWSTLYWCESNTELENEYFLLQIRVCWSKYVSIRSGIRAKSSPLRRINKVFAGKLNLTTYLGPPLKIDGKMQSVWMLRSKHVLMTWQVIRILYMYGSLCKGYLRVAMKSGWCDHHLQSLRHLTPSRRPRRVRHPWSQTLLSQEPAERWLTAWSPCWGELVTMVTMLLSFFIEVL